MKRPCCAPGAGASRHGVATLKMKLFSIGFFWSKNMLTPEKRIAFYFPWSLFWNGFTHLHAIWRWSINAPAPALSARDAFPTGRENWWVCFPVMCKRKRVAESFKLSPLCRGFFSTPQWQTKNRKSSSKLPTEHEVEGSYLKSTQLITRFRRVPISVICTTKTFQTSASASAQKNISAT